MERYIGLWKQPPSPCRQSSAFRAKPSLTCLTLSPQDREGKSVIISDSLAILETLGDLLHALKGGSELPDDEGWLFGSFTAVDAMYFQTVFHFMMNSVEIDDVKFQLTKDYFDHVLCDEIAHEVDEESTVPKDEVNQG
ncbi:hypothetical protein HDU79_005767 [Rhizoclosmatium sp. JEL0117]|nr:hypothetical protein HDU79_005767 [Rhizoclosmatium sp. JEL0117]